MAGKKRVGIVLFQLGGPDSLEAVRPFLQNLFLDPDIIPMGPLGFLRTPLAKWIAKKRSVPVAARYAMIGRRSPIGILTERQRQELVAAVSPYGDALLASADRGSGGEIAEGLSSGRDYFAAPLSAFFLRDHAKQPEGMEPRLRILRERAAAEDHQPVL